MEVEVFPDGAEWVAGAAGAIAAAVAGTQRKPRLSLGLAGGSTPRPVYMRLRSEAVPWERVDLWLSDERWVPPDDAESNGAMAVAALADHVPAGLHRPRWSQWMDPADSAAFYDARLRRLFDDGRPDVVLLGMGDDGHTASLFPDTSALDPPPARWFVANHVPKLGAWRLTATPELLHTARAVMVMVTGGAKASILAEVIENPSGRYPIELLHGCSGSVTWLVDESAASSLSRS